MILLRNCYNYKLFCKVRYFLSLSDKFIRKFSHDVQSFKVGQTKMEKGYFWLQHQLHSLTSDYGSSLLDIGLPKFDGPASILKSLKNANACYNYVIEFDIWKTKEKLKPKGEDKRA